MEPSRKTLPQIEL
uniref:Uncharacterized protein n=1 Tax=Arundo donax TaxID=35708 RepID=A0A0A8Y9A6_ARUDO